MGLAERIRTAIAGVVPPAQRSSRHFAQATKYREDGDADLAIRHYREYLRICPDDWSAWQALADVYAQRIGDVDESLRLLRYARRLRERLCTPRQGKPPHRFLNSMWADRIGRIANMEHLIKREILQGRDPKNMILYFPESQKPANQALLERMGAYITIVRDEKKLPYPRETMQSALEEYLLCESIDGLTKHWWHASAEILRAWEKAGRRPLLMLSEAEMKKGRDCLRELGLLDDAWFVGLHVGDSGSNGEQGYNAAENVLTAEIGAYLPAIRAVIERGGWIVRIGDRTMQPLPSMPGAIDYAHSALKSEWMDVFLLGACRFFIGTPSGAAYVPPLFGTPCVLINWAPAGHRPFNGRDIYIPKLHQAGFPPRQLSFAEMMAPPIGHALRYAHAEELGLATVPNTPEEIHEVVSEMLDRLDGTLSYTEADEAFQSAFDAVAETNLCIGNARAGRAFLRRHSPLLLGPWQHTP